MLSQPLDKILFAHALTLGIAPERIEIEFVRGSERCQVVFYCPEAAAPPPADDEPQPMAQKIISIIMDLDADESLLGREIASEAGYAYSGNFRKCISALAREKKIKKFPDGGYGRFPG